MLIPTTAAVPFSASLPAPQYGTQCYAFLPNTLPSLPSLPGVLSTSTPTPLNATTSCPSSSVNGGGGNICTYHEQLQRGGLGGGNSAACTSSVEAVLNALVKCPRCGKKFINAHYLEKHFRKRHSSRKAASRGRSLHRMPSSSPNKDASRHRHHSTSGPAANVSPVKEVLMNIPASPCSVVVESSCVEEKCDGDGSGRKPTQVVTKREHATITSSMTSVGSQCPSSSSTTSAGEVLRNLRNFTANSGSQSLSSSWKKIPTRGRSLTHDQEDAQDKAVAEKQEGDEVETAGDGGDDDDSEKEEGKKRRKMGENTRKILQDLITVKPRTRSVTTAASRRRSRGGNYDRREDDGKGRGRSASTYDSNDMNDTRRSRNRIVSCRKRESNTSARGYRSCSTSSSRKSRSENGRRKSSRSRRSLGGDHQRVRHTSVRFNDSDDRHHSRAQSAGSSRGERKVVENPQKEFQKLTVQGEKRADTSREGETEERKVESLFTTLNQNFEAQLQQTNETLKSDFQLALKVRENRIVRGALRGQRTTTSRI